MARFHTDHNVSLHTAVEQGRILITHNEVHFSVLHGAWLLWSAARQVAPQHGGVLIIPQWVPTLGQWGPAGAAQELTNFVEQHPSIMNELYIQRRGTGWRLIHP